MDDLLKIVLTIIGSGAFFSFIQFLITRRDNRTDKVKILEQEMHKGLDERENTGRERYEEHREAIEELRETMLKLAKTSEEQQQYTKAVANVLIGLAQDKLVYLTKFYTERGAITLDELAVLEDIYTPYHEDLGGNGRGKAGFERCSELPVVSEEKALEMDRQRNAS